VNVLSGWLGCAAPPEVAQVQALDRFGRVGTGDTGDTGAPPAVQCRVLRGTFTYDSDGLLVEQHDDYEPSTPSDWSTYTTRWEYDERGCPPGPR
jgi:hypothetical protein